MKVAEALHYNQKSFRTACVSAVNAFLVLYALFSAKRETLCNKQLNNTVPVSMSATIACGKQ